MAESIDWDEGTVRATRDLTPDIRLFEISPPRFFTPPAPGCHVHVLLPIGERTEMRSYSTVGACADGVCRIAVKLLPASRGGSRYMWRLAPGAKLTMSAPRNRFALTRGRSEYLLVAGGIGITPLYGMALALAEAGQAVRLLYGVRRRADLAFGAELRAALGARLEVFVAEEGGRIDLPGEIAKLKAGAELYVCGPIGQLEAAKHAWRASGRPMEDLRFETFGNSGRYPTEAFTVRIPRLGITIDVPRTSTLLDALEAAGVGMIYDCRRGECGLCALPILSVEGVVDHRDVFFSEEEKAGNGNLCTCVSRSPGGCLTLDTGDRLI